MQEQSHVEKYARYQPTKWRYVINSSTAGECHSTGSHVMLFSYPFSASSKSSSCEKHARYHTPLNKLYIWLSRQKGEIHVNLERRVCRRISAVALQRPRYHRFCPPPMVWRKPPPKLNPAATRVCYLACYTAVMRSAYQVATKMKTQLTVSCTRYIRGSE